MLCPLTPTSSGGDERLDVRDGDGRRGFSGFPAHAHLIEPPPRFLFGVFHFIKLGKIVHIRRKNAARNMLSRLHVLQHPPASPKDACRLHLGKTARLPPSDKLRWAGDGFSGHGITPIK